MARIRTIKPSFFRHSDLYDLEQETGLPIRVAFSGLWTVCDREGRFKWNPRELKLDCLPHDQVDFSRVLDALTTRGFICRYTVAGVEYGCVPSWHIHQIVNNREAPSELPPPNQDADIEQQSTRQPRVSHASATRHGVAQAEQEQEQEGKGKETIPHPNPSPQLEPVELSKPVGAVSSEEPKSDYPLDNPDSPVFDITRGWLALIEKTFGKQSARLAPAADDKIFAKRWLDDGLLITEIMLYLEGSLAKIKEKGGKPPSGLKYFDKFIRENLKQSPKATENFRNNPVKNDAFWKMRMTGFVKNNIWPDGAGEPPGRDGCDVPPEILREFGFNQITGTVTA